MALELVDLTLLAINVTLVLGLYLYLLGHGLIGYRGTVQVCHVSIVKLRPFEQIEQAVLATQCFTGFRFNDRCCRAIWLDPAALESLAFAFDGFTLGAECPPAGIIDQTQLASR